MPDNVTIQVGDKNYVIEPSHLPPVGTCIVAHKHFSNDGTDPLLEVVNYEWRLEEAPDENSLPVFLITIKTRIVK